MIKPDAGPDIGVAALRRKLLAGMVIVIVALTAGGLTIAERAVSAETQHAFHRAFESELELLRTVREIRHASLAERCAALVRKPRIHAALEDNALDMLYPSAGDELGDVLADTKAPGEPFARHSIHARFYRFLDDRGNVLPAANALAVGVMEATEENRLGFAGLPREQQTGYL